MAQERVQKTRATKTHSEETNSDVTNPSASKNEASGQAGEKIAEIDELLDEQTDDELLTELDDVLGTEEEAAEMVANFIQQGGE